MMTLRSGTAPCWRSLGDTWAEVNTGRILIDFRNDNHHRRRSFPITNIFHGNRADDSSAVSSDRQKRIIFRHGASWRVLRYPSHRDRPPETLFQRCANRPREPITSGLAAGSIRYDVWLYHPRRPPPETGDRRASGHNRKLPRGWDGEAVEEQPARPAVPTAQPTTGGRRSKRHQRMAPARHARNHPVT